MVNLQKLNELQIELGTKSVTLVAVSKTKPVSDIQGLYNAGQRDFGENYVQELVEKETALPKDINWHFIGHLQGNKVKYIAPFVYLIHAVDNAKLLAEINKQAAKCGRTIDVLLQLHIAAEETKFGMDEMEVTELIKIYLAPDTLLKNVRICGLMGMATNTSDEAQVRHEFAQLNTFFQQLKATTFQTRLEFKMLSMGMSADYAMAIEEGSNMVRIGSLLFGSRQ